MRCTSTEFFLQSLKSIRWLIKAFFRRAPSLSLWRQLLDSFSGKVRERKMGRCGHHPILSLTTPQCTLPFEWAPLACISFTTHLEHGIHLHFHPLKRASKSAPLTQNCVVAERVGLTQDGGGYYWKGGWETKRR